MKTLSVLLMLASFYIGPVAKAQDQPMNDLELKITDASRSGHITVRVSNSSKGAVNLWQETNSWGAARWRVLRIRKGQLETFFQNPNQRFTRNIPTTTEVTAGEHVDQRLDLNGGNWCGFGRCSSHNERGFGDREAGFESGDMVVVIYDVPHTDEARKMGVWCGVTAALTIVQQLPHLGPSLSPPFLSHEY